VKEGTDAVESNGETISGLVAWEILVLPYVKSTQVFSCPSNTRVRTTRVRETGSSASNDIRVSYICNGVFGNTSTGYSNPTQYWGGDPPMARYSPPELDGGAALASMTAPSELLLVMENNGSSTAGYIGTHISFTDGSDNFQNHLGVTNFLFCDGHVKAMKPRATIVPVQMWNVANGFATAAGNPLGAALTTQNGKLN
jgi:prepilin-type processing-associated H-X9-DG protein